MDKTDLRRQRERREERKERTNRNNEKRDEKFKESILSDAAGEVVSRSHRSRRGGGAKFEPIRFPGSQSFTKGRSVVASFPGKYANAWNMIIGGEQEYVNLSSNGLQKVKVKKRIAVDTCCVFLPDESSEGYGVHDHSCRDGRCWCEMLLEEGGLGYGRKEPWGCQWYTMWQANMSKAIAADVNFIVFYFREHSQSMGQADWDNVGNSQKAEINYMLKNGIPFEDHPIDVFLDVAVETEKVHQAHRDYW